MVMRINPNQQPLWRTPFQMQLGTGSNSVVLKELSTAQERLIAALYNGIADRQLPLISKQLGLSSEQTTEVISAVGDLLLLENPGQQKDRKLDDSFVSSAFAEIIRASLLHSADGESVLLSRGDRTVHIEELSQAGLSVALGLAAAGIGNLISHDENQVEKKDLGPTGFPSQLLGRPRLDALRSLLAASPNQALVSTGKKLSNAKLQKIDCAVLISHQVTEPKRYSSWVNRDIPHVLITFETDKVSVSPMIIPGQTACLFCLEKMRTDNDEKWPVIATQLISSSKRFDDSASSYFAAGVVIQKILARLDRVSGFELAQENLIGFNLELKSGLVTQLTWPKHADCGCQAIG
jgi:hypothetical protein